MNRRISGTYLRARLALVLGALSLFAAVPIASGQQGSRSTRRGEHRVPDRLRISSVKPGHPQILSADQAMGLVRAGNRVLIATEAGASQALIDALGRRALALNGKKGPIEVVHAASLVQYPADAAAQPDKFRVHALFINSGARALVGKGLRITPTYLSEIPNLVQGTLRPNVVFIKVAPGDPSKPLAEQRYFNTGVSADYISEVAANPRVKVIAEVTDQMPTTRGATRIHASHVDAVVQTNSPVTELSWGPSSLVDMAIGRNVAREVPDGATLQLGIGPLQKAVAEQLAKHGRRINDGGGRFKVKVRSEMIDDGLMYMANAGIISDTKNAIQLGFLVGTSPFYKYVAGERRIVMRPTREINDPFKAGKVSKLMAINSGVAVDLYGQACAEMIPRKGADGSIIPVPYSGVGGQVDFFRAVRRSRGGKGMLTLRSTAKNGALSSITLDMPQGLVVTTNRYDTDRVVTEWGVAELRGKDTAERAQALVRVAHPKFRAQLAAQGEQRFGGDHAAWVAAAQVAPRELQLAKWFDASDAKLAAAGQ